jgi:RNA polymerase sigma factor (sigma-70 family)
MDMTNGPMQGVVQRLRRCATDDAEPTDGQLLERFLTGREEAAFEALVRRHGRMVLGVCQRILHNSHDAEDAFQATFLVLVRKGASVRPRDLVGNWLYGVAYRTALEAKAAAARRRIREREASAMPRGETTADAGWQELRPLLDQELNRLPDRYRAAIVLCDLEGYSRHEAARRLGWPEGTLSSRLARGRGLLARRLVRRGVVVTGAALATVLPCNAVSASLPASLVVSTVQSATAPVVSAEVGALVEGVVKAMLVSKLKICAAGTLLLAGLIIIGTYAWPGSTPDSVSVARADDRPAPPPAEPPAAGPSANAPFVVLDGRLVDRRGQPIAGAKIINLCRTPNCGKNLPPLLADAKGRFQVKHKPNGLLHSGDVLSLQIVTPGGPAYEVNPVVVAGRMDVEVPTILNARVKGPDKVAADELAGVVVDAAGKPLEGVHVHVWDWFPTYQTTTGKDGVFRIKGLDRESTGAPAKVEVRFQKAGYSPETFIWAPAGASGWVVSLDQKTYLEGTVRGPDGKPAAGARIRADQGPRGHSNGILPHIWTETQADASGHYRLYLQPDEYELTVKAPGRGVARLPRKTIAHGKAYQLDIPLEKGVAFRAVAVDATTGKPVPNVRLFYWQEKDIDGRTDARGEVTIGDMLPGRFQFWVEAGGYARWWSEDAVNEWCRKKIDNAQLHWQRNFDFLDFDLRPGMAPVKIELEKGVRIRGRVVDPEGKPVAGATVAPALTGTGNSLTGDTRFSAETKADGTFDVLMPASNEARYNLVAHDGKYGQWRRWANGVLPPMQTKPGQEMQGVELKLTRPATVRGKVVDVHGKPIAHREVRAHAADKLENRYYDPTTTTKDDGTFELRFIRAGDQFIQTAPFWLHAEEAPASSTKRLTLKSGQTATEVKLVGSDPEPALSVPARR